MLRSVKDLEKCAIGATDGTIGRIGDCYFDDEAWVVRYLAVDTGHWLSNRQVLISPHSIRDWGWQGDVVPVSITREQVRRSPEIDTAEPISRQHEREYYGYYGYPYYWGGRGLWGDLASPHLLPGAGGIGPDALTGTHEDHHLRSCNAVAGYCLHASDGDIGHVGGFLIDEHTWAIRYLVVDTSNWWLGHQVLVAPEWIVGIDWRQSAVTTDLARQAVKDSPPYDRGIVPDTTTEARIYRHYGRGEHNRPSGKRHIG